MTLEAIAALLGHRSLDMTLRYAKIANRTVADEYFAVTEKVESLYQQGHPLPAGTLVTLLFGLSALVTKPESYRLAVTPRIALTVGTILFLSSAVLALLVGLPVKERSLSPIDLQGKLKLDATWSRSAVQAMKDVAIARADVLADRRCHTQRKAWLLVAALSLEIAAVAAVAVAIVVILV